MKPFRLAVIAAAMTATTGCTTIKGWFVDEDKVNQKIKANQELSIPEGFANPKKSNEYTLPPGEARAADLNVISSPTSVLVLLEKSWINEEDKHPAKIMVEKPDLVEDFPAFIKTGVESYAQQKNVLVEKVSDQRYKMTLPIEIETGFWLWGENVKAEEFVYHLTVDMKPHGRSGEIYIDPVDYTRIDEELASRVPEALRSETLAIQSLNDLMLEMDYLYRVVVKKEQTSLDVTLAQTKDASGNPVLSSQQDIIYVWEQLEDILEQLGFNIEEEDEELHIYSVSYDKDQQSVWDSLFNADYANVLDIESGEYEVLLTTSVEGVHIKFRDKLGNMFSEAQVNQAFELIMAIVKDDDLEI